MALLICKMYLSDCFPAYLYCIKHKRCHTACFEAEAAPLLAIKISTNQTMPSCTAIAQVNAWCKANPAVAPSQEERRDEDDSDEEAGGDKGKRKSKEERQLKISDLKQFCPRPEVVEIWDTTAQDPRLLVYLKADPEIILYVEVLSFNLCQLLDLMYRLPVKMF